MNEDTSYHIHVCQKCNKTWSCNDNSGDGSDTDCRWFHFVVCSECHRKYLNS